MRLLLSLAVILAAILVGCAANPVAPDPGCACDLPSPVAFTPGPSAIVLPNAALTPGIVLTLDTVAICKPGYSGTVRSVPQSEKDQVYAEYGIKSHTAGQYEVDHLISLELGGSNDIKNLWPQPAEPRPGFHEKDALENVLHTLVCTGKVPIAQAQHEIATDWWGAYQKYVASR